MHTIMVIGGGMVLLTVFLLAGRLLGRSPGGVADAAKYFIALWLVAALINMWIGVSRAGYTVLQELPILLVVFAVPAAAALYVWWKFSRRRRRAGLGDVEKN